MNCKKCSCLKFLKRIMRKDKKGISYSYGDYQRLFRIRTKCNKEAKKEQKKVTECS